jgi:hypothetical protein
MGISLSTKIAKGREAELAAIGRLAGAGIPETEIRQAIALMRTGRADLLALVIAGDLDVARARCLARQPQQSLMKREVKV